MACSEECSKGRGDEGGPDGERDRTVGIAAAARAAKTRKATYQAQALAPIIDRIDPTRSASLRSIAAQLMKEGVPAPGGGEKWTAATVLRIRRRVDKIQVTQKR